MNNKKTAMKELIHWLKCGWMDENIEAVIRKAEILLEKEKDQIKDAYIICEDSGTLEESKVYAEQYYNRTYEQ